MQVAGPVAYLPESYAYGEEMFQEVVEQIDGIERDGREQYLRPSYRFYWASLFLFLQIVAGPTLYARIQRRV